MDKLALALLLLFAAPLSGASKDAGNYTIKVHVACSYARGQSGSHSDTQRLGVVIEGRQLELSTPFPSGAVLAPGDYKARLKSDLKLDAYDVQQTYEFLFADGKTRSYEVSGLGGTFCTSPQ